MVSRGMDGRHANSDAQLNSASVESGLTLWNRLVGDTVAAFGQDTHPSNLLEVISCSSLHQGADTCSSADCKERPLSVGLLMSYQTWVVVKQVMNFICSIYSHPVPLSSLLFLYLLASWFTLLICIYVQHSSLCSMFFPVTSFFLWQHAMCHPPLAPYLLSDVIVNVYSIVLVFILYLFSSLLLFLRRSFLQSLSTPQEQTLSCMESLCCYQQGQSGCSRLAHYLEQMTAQCQDADHCHASGRNNRWEGRQRQSMKMKSIKASPPCDCHRL